MTESEQMTVQKAAKKQKSKKPSIVTTAEKANVSASVTEEPEKKSKFFQALDAWGTRPNKAEVASMLREALKTDPPTLAAPILISLRLLLRIQPPLRQLEGNLETDGKLLDRAVAAGWNKVI